MWSHNGYIESSSVFTEVVFILERLSYPIKLTKMDSSDRGLLTSIVYIRAHNRQELTISGRVTGYWLSFEIRKQVDSRVGGCVEHILN